MALHKLRNPGRSSGHYARALPTGHGRCGARSAAILGTPSTRVPAPALAPAASTRPSKPNRKTTKVECPARLRNNTAEIEKDVTTDTELTIEGGSGLIGTGHVALLAQFDRNML